MFISFSLTGAAPGLAGIALEPVREIMFHARGERLHQRTDGPSSWGLISLSPASLAAFCETETGGALPLPEVGRISDRPGATGSACFTCISRRGGSPGHGRRSSAILRWSAPWNMNWPGSS